MKKRVISLLLWAAFALMLGKSALTLVHNTGVPIAGNDFPAFYCAGLLADKHADPYLVEPLRACEHLLPNGNDQSAAFVTPAPLPGYAVAIFATLARLPYQAAAWAWFILLVAAILALAFLLSSISKAYISSAVAAIALLYPAALATVIYGQLPVIAVLGITIAGTGLARQRNISMLMVPFGIALAMIEPHLGLAAALGCFFLVPSTRIPLTVLALFLAAVSIGTLGVHENLEYFTQVLPTHARAELGAVDQFSLSHIATFFGVNPGAAVSLGTLSYLVMLALGIAYAKPLAEKMQVPEAFAVLPAAAILLGGSFLHEIQLVAVLPLAFLLAGRFAGQKTSTLFLASVLTITIVGMIPFSLYQEHHPIAGNGFTNLSGSSTLSSTATSFAPSAVSGTADASANWELFETTDPAYAQHSPGAEMAKVPFWACLFFLFAALGWKLRTKTRSVPGGMPVRSWLEGPEIRVT